MSYKGQVFTLPFGQLGLRTDEAATVLPPYALIEANNIRISNNRIEKSPGVTKITSSALGSKIFALKEYRPTSDVSRTIIITENGTVWRDAGAGPVSIGTLSTPLIQQNIMMLEAGLEVTGQPKKLFIFSGNNQIKVITSDGASLSNIANPNTDWAASGYPTFGFIYLGRVIVLGGANDPHRIYVSDFADHEDFTAANTETLDFSIFTGEADRVFAGIVFRGVALLFKYPFGVYVLDGRQDLTSPQISKYSDAFGLASPQALAQGLGDVLGLNTFGSLTSLNATDQFGDLEAGDVFANAKVEDYFRQALTESGFIVSQAIYYPEKKSFYFTARAAGTTEQNRIIIIDVNSQQPRITLETKDEPCALALLRDANNIQRPIYGDSAGDIFLMDSNSYNVDNAAYEGSAQFAYTDLSFLDNSLADKNKNFDFLTVTYRAVGNYPFYCDVFIDEALRDTILITVNIGSALDSFVLDTDVLGEPGLRSGRFPIRSGFGKRISLKFYNTALNQGFIIEQVTIAFRPSNEGVSS